MEPIIIPNPIELPQSPDPINFVRRKVSDEIRQASCYQKHVSIVFKKNPLFCTEQWKSVQNFGHFQITWNLEMFEKIAAECLEMGYSNVSIKKEYKTIEGGGYGVSRCDRIVMYISWDVNSPE